MLDWSTAVYPPNLMTASEGDFLAVAQLAPASANGVDYLAAQRKAYLQFTQTNGQTNSVPASMTAVAQDQALTIDWKVAAFEALVDEVNPRATVENEFFDVYAALLGPDGGIVSGPLPARMMESNQPAGSGLEGTFAYGNPYPTSVVPYALFVTYMNIDVAVDGTTAHPFSATMNTQMKIVDGKVKLTAPMISPPRKPKVAEASFWQGGDLDSITPVVSWEAPSSGKAVGYAVSVWQANVSGTRTSVAKSGTILTPRTSVRVPSGMVSSGTHVFFVVAAYAQPGVDFEVNPFSSTLPFAAASTVSDIFRAP